MIPDVDENIIRYIYSFMIDNEMSIYEYEVIMILAGQGDTKIMVYINQIKNRERSRIIDDILS